MDGPGTGARHAVLYDGVCGLCNGVVRFVLARDPGGRFAFATLQGEAAGRILARHGRTGGGLDTFVLVLDLGRPGERVLDRSDAAARLLVELGGPWRGLGRALALVPRPVRDLGYRVVARTRYAVFGRHAVCPLPGPGARSRFLDS